MSWNCSCSLFKAEDALSSTSSGKLETRAIKTFGLAGKNSTFQCLLQFLPQSWQLYQSCPQNFLIFAADTVLWRPALMSILLILVEPGLYGGPWLSCLVYLKMHWFSGGTHFTRLASSLASHTQDLPFHPFAKPLHIQRHPVPFWHPFSLSEATFLKQLLHRAGNPLQMVGAVALPEQRLGFLETWRGVHSGLHLALLSLPEVKESCSLFCPKDVFHHCGVWRNSETCANAAVNAMVLGLCTGFGFSAWDTVWLCVVLQLPQASPSVPCPPLFLSSNSEMIEKLVETESSSACGGDR